MVKWSKLNLEMLMSNIFFVYSQNLKLRQKNISSYFSPHNNKVVGHFKVTVYFLLVTILIKTENFKAGYLSVHLVSYIILYHTDIIISDK